MLIHSNMPILLNEYLAIDSGGNEGDLVVARNYWNASRRSRVGVGMNRSVREGKKCKAL